MTSPLALPLPIRSPPWLPRPRVRGRSMAVRAQTDAHGWEIPRRGMGARHEWGVRLERTVESSRLVVAFHGARFSACGCGVIWL